MGDTKSDGRATLREVFAAARDRELTAGELRLWLLYRSHEEPDRGAFPGDERLAAMMDVSVRTVERHRARLLQDGYLEQTLRGPKPALYRAVLPPKDPTPVADHTGESPDTSGEASAERPDTSGESRHDPPKGSPKGSPLVSPEYGEYGEKQQRRGAWPKPSDLSRNGSGHLDYPAPFEAVWKAYPRRKGKKATYRKIRSLVKDGEDPAHLREAAAAYAAEMRRQGRDQQHIKLPATFFGPDDWWREELRGNGGPPREPPPDRHAILDALDGGAP